MSFYYWKTKFSLNEKEKKILQTNEVKEIYVRYFDVVIDKKTNLPIPRGIINSLQKQPWQYIPVIYLKNEIFEHSKDYSVDSLCKNIWNLVQKLDHDQNLQPNTIQFDCDWTESTKEPYFLFLKKFKRLSHLPLSATIRLHQIKYSFKTGVPPVEKGVLMFYNMGEISAENNNAIYDQHLSEKYLSNLENYPLILDIALPIFSWSIQIRNGHVQQLLNKMNNAHFDKDVHFTVINTNRYLVKSSCFKGGYYFIEGDEIKVEKVTQKDLSSMVVQINKHKRKPSPTIIFYDLDTFNTNNYDEEIYKNLAKRLN